jgi:hypothetical protein
MRLGIGVLALLVAAAVPAVLFAGATTLRGLGWLVVVAVGALLLIDLGDRLTEWVERRRWGRLPSSAWTATPRTRRPETPRALRRPG